jgi:NADPH:quinone reductase-like Zn-dependent oxidoreductase
MKPAPFPAPAFTLLAFIFLACAPVPAAAQIRATTRRVVLEKVDNGYRWKLVEVRVPTIGARQVLVHVRAVALNRGDLEMLEPDEGRDRSGLVVASDAAGDVVAVGADVTSVRTGDRVTSLYFRNWTDGPASDEKLRSAHGATVDGVLGDYIALEETAVAPLVDSLSYEEGAALPTAGLTAWMATAGRCEIRKGDVVVVQGMCGVSTFALQFAAASGARVIITSSSDDKLRRAQALGARDGVNYKTTPAWSARVLELTDRHGPDIVVDVGGKGTLEQSAKSLAYGGTLSIVGGLSGYDGEIPALGLLLKTAQAHGVYVGSRADYLRMNAFMVEHRLRPVIDRVYSLGQFDAALKHMASGNFVGKVVVRL